MKTVLRNCVVLIGSVRRQAGARAYYHQSVRSTSQRRLPECSESWRLSCFSRNGPCSKMKAASPRSVEALVSRPCPLSDLWSYRDHDAAVGLSAAEGKMQKSDGVRINCGGGSQPLTRRCGSPPGSGRWEFNPR